MKHFDFAKYVKHVLPVFGILFFSSITQVKAQIEQGNLLVGGNIADFNLGLNKAPFSMRIDPKVAMFVTDNLALGGYVDLGLQSQTGSSNLTYGAGALGRYYLNKSKLAVIKHSKIFFEGTFGYQGQHEKETGFPNFNTNGIGFGFGPGISYFITSNVALEALAKYNGNLGFGNRPYAHNIDLGIGFQIFLPTSKLDRMLKDVKAK